MTLLPGDIRRLRALADAASPGPWSSRGYAFNNGKGTVGFCNGFQDECSGQAERIGPHNAEFIAAARAALPAALEEIERLRAVADAAESWALRDCSSTRAELLDALDDLNRLKEKP